MAAFDDFLSQVRATRGKNTQDYYNEATGQEGANAATDRNRYLDLLNNGQQAFETSARAAMEAAMPAFSRQLQGVRESAARRGLSTGDLGTSYEGDLTSAFQKNTANAIAQQALGLYGERLGSAGSLYGMEHNNYLDLLSGQLDRKQAAKNARAQANASMWGGVLSGLGAVGSAAILA